MRGKKGREAGRKRERERQRNRERERMGFEKEGGGRERRGWGGVLNVLSL